MHTRKLALFMTNAPTFFSSTLLPATVMLLTNNGNNSMTACERLHENQWRTQDFFRGGSTNSVEDRENGDLEAVAP